MKIKFIAVSIAILFLFSCGHVQQRDTAVDSRCKKHDITEFYFTDWVTCLKCAGEVIRTKESSEKDVQIANFILGENSFLKYNDKESTDLFMNAVAGPDRAVSMAALSYLYKIDRSFRSIKDLVKKDTAHISDKLVRLLIDRERLNWALSADNKSVFNDIGSQILVPGGLKLQKTDHKKTGRKFLPENSGTGQTKEIIPQKNGTIDIKDYFTETDGTFYLSGYFFLPSETDLTVLVETKMGNRIYVDGFLTENKSLFLLSEGNHRVDIELDPDEESDGEVSVFIPFYNSDVSVRKEGEETGSCSFIETEAGEKTAFFKYIGLINTEKVSADDYFGLYSSVMGSFSPPFIYRLAERALEERSVERGLSYLKKIAEKHDLIRPRLKIKEWLFYLGRKKELDLFEKQYGKEIDNVHSGLFELDRYSLEKHYLAGLVMSRDIFKKYRDYPASYYYLAGAYEDLGYFNEALEVRLALLKELPYHIPLLTSIEKIAGRLEKRNIVEKVLRRKIERNPDGIKLLSRLADNFFKSGKYEKASDIYDRILKLSGNDLSALIGKGDIFFVTGKKKKAEQYYLKAFLLYPESSKASKKADLFRNTDYSDFFDRHSRSDEEVLKMVKDLKTETDVPYTVIFDEGSYRIVNHNLIVSRFRMVIKVNTLSGVKEFIKTEYPGELLNASIIRDGKVIRVNKAEEGVLDLKTLTQGDIIDYSFQTVAQNDYWLKGFSDLWLFGDIGTLYLNSEVSIYIPEGMKFNYYISKGVNDPEIKSDDGGKVYLFSKKNTYLSPEENNMPDRFLIIPNLQFSVINGWDDFAKWQVNFIREGAKATENVEKKTFSVIKSSDAPLTVIKKLRNFVANDVRYRSIDPGELSVRPESVDVTLDRMSGDCKDKALLLKTMLNLAGIRSSYALIKSKYAGPFIKQVPSMQFDHAMVYIPAQKGVPEGGFFVDPTSGYDSTFGLNRALVGVEAMIIEDNDLSYEFKEVKENSKGTADLIFRSGGRSSAIFSGTSASMIRFNLASGKSPEEVLSRFFPTGDGASEEVSDVTVKEGAHTDPMILEFSYKGKFPLIVSNIYGKDVKGGKRNYPFVLPYLSEKISFTFKVEGKVSFVEDNKFFRYLAESGEDGVLKVDFVVKKWTINSEEFAELEKYVINVMMFESKITEGTDG